jgi:hypothetical protein
MPARLVPFVTLATLLAGCAESPWAQATPQQRALWMQQMGGSIRNNALPSTDPVIRSQELGGPRPIVCRPYDGDKFICQ